MLAGGAEAPLAPLTFAAFSIIRAMSTPQRRSGSRHPGRSTRAATVSSWARSGGARLGNAAGRWRGGQIYAEVVGTPTPTTRIT